MEQSILFPEWGGARAGAGRKASEFSGMPHLTRDEVKERHPMHITNRVFEDVPNLRHPDMRTAYFKVFEEANEAFGCRLVEFSVMSNHFHFIVEAPCKESLARFMIGLKVRLAKAINKVAGRVGSVFTDRFHREDIKNLKRTRNALRYVLCNASKHGIRYEGRVDPCSSAAWFDGFSDGKTPLESSCTVAKAKSWLLQNWMEHYDLIDPDSYKPK